MIKNIVFIDLRGLVFKPVRNNVIWRAACDEHGVFRGTAGYIGYRLKMNTPFVRQTIGNALMVEALNPEMVYATGAAMQRLCAIPNTAVFATMRGVFDDAAVNLGQYYAQHINGFKNITGYDVGNIFGKQYPFIINTAAQKNYSNSEKYVVSAVPANLIRYGDFGMKTVLITNGKDMGAWGRRYGISTFNRLRSFVEYMEDIQR